MKILKNILISSDGSCHFINSGEILLSNKFVTFKKQDDKNFVFNKKKIIPLLTQNNRFTIKESI